MSAVKLDRDLVSATIKLGDTLAVAYNSEAMAWKRLADGSEEPDVDEISAIQTKPFPTRNAFSESASELAKHLAEIGIDATSILKSVQAANHYVSWYPREWFDCKAYLTGLLNAAPQTSTSQELTQSQADSAGDRAAPEVDIATNIATEKAVLDSATVARIEQRLNDGNKVRELAKEFGLTQKAILETEPCIKKIRDLVKHKTQEVAAAELGTDRKTLGDAGKSAGIQFTQRGKNFRKSQT